MSATPNRTRENGLKVSHSSLNISFCFLSPSDRHEIQHFAAFTFSLASPRHYAAFRGKMGTITVLIYPLPFFSSSCGDCSLPFSLREQV